MGSRVREDGSGDSRRDGVFARKVLPARKALVWEELAGAEEISCADEIAGAMAIASVGVGY